MGERNEEIWKRAKEERGAKTKSKEGNRTFSSFHHDLTFTSNNQAAIQAMDGDGKKKLAWRSDKILHVYIPRQRRASIESTRVAL